MVCQASRKKKRSDIRARFRGDDRQHLGALLELSIHEVLCAVGTGVQVDPVVDKDDSRLCIDLPGHKNYRGMHGPAGVRR